MKQTIEKGNQYVMQTYGPRSLSLAKGEGVYVWDEDGNKYLDFVAGISVNALGHNHKALVEAIAKQAARLIHISNLYYAKEQVQVAETLVSHSCFDRAFFCNSGAEAVEAGLKLARKYATLKNKNGYEIIAMDHSFHGRTLGAITATGQPKYQEGLGPLLPDITHVPFNDFDALKEKVSAKTCGIVLEPVQGEGGIVPAGKEYLQKVRALCDEKDIVLIFDEVQCGVGRTGKLFAYEYYGVQPDVVAMAKGLAGGVPAGCMMAKAQFAAAFKPGDHASTFGGNPLAMAASQVVLDQLLHHGLLENIAKQGQYLQEKLTALQKKYAFIQDVRGVGLLQGIELDREAGPLIQRCKEKGLLLVGSGAKVIRFVPPYIVTSAQIDEAMGILDEVFG